MRVGGSGGGLGSDLGQLNNPNFRDQPGLAKAPTPSVFGDDMPPGHDHGQGGGVAAGLDDMPPGHDHGQGGGVAAGLDEMPPGHDHGQGGGLGSGEESQLPPPKGSPKGPPKGPPKSPKPSSSAPAESSSPTPPADAKGSVLASPVSRKEKRQDAG